MDEAGLIEYVIDTFDGVETTTAYTYTFFFYGADRMLPFATLATADNEYDRISDLDRPGVFRLNIGVRKPTFVALFGQGKVDVGSYDFTVLDQLMPHPEYASQGWICVLNPSDALFQHTVRPFLAEAYEMAVQRHLKRHSKDKS